MNNTSFGAVFIFVCAFAFGGCSVVGFSVGAIVDSSTPDYSSTPFDAVERGKNVRVFSNDSAWTSGVYQGLEPLNASEYATRYEEFQRQSQTSLPSLGDTLVLRMGGQAVEYVFRGFRVRSIYVEPLIPSSFDSALIQSRLRSIDAERGSESTPLPYHFLNKLERRNGTLLDPVSLLTLKTDLLLPLNDALVLKVNGESHHLPVNDIVSVEELYSNNAKWLGVGIGILIDLIVLVSLPKLSISGPRLSG